MVGVDVVKHVRVLIATQPFVFPVEAHGKTTFQQLLQDLIVCDTARIKVLYAIFCEERLQRKVWGELKLVSNTEWFVLEVGSGLA